MALEDKALLLNELGNRMADVLTVDNMAKVMDIISDTMETFDVVGTITNDDLGPDDLMDAYLAALRVQGRSEGTIERYRYAITRMMNSVRVHTRKITVYHIRTYLLSERDRGVKDSTVEGIRQVFNAYFNWLHREGLIKVNPMANLGAIKCEKKIKKVYTEVDVDLMKTGCTSTRDKAIVCFLSSTGCRISEMTSLNIDNVDIANKEAVIHGKGNKERTVYMDLVTATLLKQYIEERTDDNPALFVNRFKHRIEPNGVRAMLNNVADKMGVSDVYPHKFRRTFATNMIRRGAPIQSVAALMGHDKLDTTMTYIVLDKTDNQMAYRKYA